LSILAIVVPLALALGLFFVLSFLWSLKNGQCDDLESPKHRAILDQEEK
jgi:cbb3-type cytochrome oxidase maturation protein